LETHQKGKRIRPKSKKYLAIPLSRLTYGRWPRDFQKGELFPIKTRNGNLILAMAKGKGKRRRILPMFVLKRSVKIPKRLTIIEDFKKTGSQLIKKQMVRSLRQWEGIR